ncbi:hypothetical protein RTG_01215 [Rhodotorula toruloides ATCC 204091]|uniref:AN1-type domain-containing protein n=1 Tax=Rhodotorula toruloides TaxID=5286 RepID=A0A0K3C776_RHOTO|nr:hypothetical protein RTG_01215 [Rhodotorula toruloides ATCC 204091]KAK4331499.1 AN1-type domain-containing protein [Rhodotorula toruloides]PRQ77912.1 hypothetical protein AAT19DRAFT_8980 [Rhodotorula toruloides]
MKRGGGDKDGANKGWAPAGEAWPCCAGRQLLCDTLALSNEAHERRHRSPRLLISCDEALFLMASAPPAELGAHCSLPSCNALDFLPIVCLHCSASFCGRHAPPSSHSCPSDPSTSSLSPDELDASRADDQPSFRSLLPDPKRHKRETSEPSEEERVKKEGQQAALAKLKASFAKGKAGTTSTPPTPSATAKKPNPTLDLMRLKGRAVPADPKHVKRAGDVPMSDRLFLKVQHAKVAAKEPDVREVWVSKDITAGKALDLFADLFKVTNDNNATTDPSKLLSLGLPDDPPTRLTLSEPLSAQVANGGTVQLYKGILWP